jgi:hypothetical protein
VRKSVDASCKRFVEGLRKEGKVLMKSRLRRKSIWKRIGRDALAMFQKRNGSRNTMVFKDWTLKSI